MRVLAFFLLLLLGACDAWAGPLEIPQSSLMPAGSSRTLSTASAPDEVPFTFIFDDLNPCSGEIHTVMITGTAFVHDHNGRMVARLERMITTSSGYIGRGTSTEITNGSIQQLVLNDVLIHPSGARIKAHLVIIVDVSSGETRVTQGAVTCIRS